MDFIDYISVNYPVQEERPLWLETFFQVFSWQYCAFHEGVDTYYSNDYGYSEPRTITQTAQYLEDNGYKIIAVQYIAGMRDHMQSEVGKWLIENTEPVWVFYLDILEKHKNDWPEIKKRSDKQTE